MSLRPGVRRTLMLRDTATPFVLATMALTGVLVVVYFLSTVFRPENASSPIFDGYIGNLGYAGCALLCWWRVIRHGAQRRAWVAVALSLTLFTIGAVLWTDVVQYWTSIPYPSISDGFFLAFYPVAYVGVGLLVRESAPRSPSVWIDGVISALGIAAIEAVFVIGKISHGNHGNAATVATNLAYPIGDLVLVMMLIALFAMRGWRPPAMWWTVGSGFAIFAIADTVYVLRVTSGSYVTGTPLDSMWLIGTFLIAIAAWQRPHSQRPERLHAQPVVIPTLFVLSSLSIVFADGTLVRVHPLGLFFATGTLLVAFAWMGHSYRQLRLLAESRRQALTDELTGLGNRRVLTTYLQTLLDDPSVRLATLLVDLDRFKEINDAFGHPTGDELLANLGPRLRMVLRSADVLVRLGGDEFAVVLTDADSDYAIDVAERLAQQLTRPFELADVTVHVSASIGIALAPEHSRDTSGLLRCADVAMYRAKATAGGFAVYSPALDHNKERFELLGDLRRAIASRALSLYFQPQVDLSTGDVRSVEALLRWSHPTRGVIPPDKFIPLAEDARLMRELTELVLDKALDQSAVWAKDGYSFPVAVNVSTTNLLDDELPVLIRRKLEAHDLSPARLILEITESTLMRDPERARRVLTRLHAMGVEISVDDFGTGYSSLAYLRGLPVDELKLDRSFVKDLANGVARDTALARSALYLGRALGLRVVAEGVEDVDTLTALRTLGFDAAQGYFLGVPSPADELMLPAPADALT